MPMPAFISRAQAKIANFTANKNANDGVRISQGSLNVLQSFTADENSRYGVWLFARTRNNVGPFDVENNTIAGVYVGCWSTGPQNSPSPCKPVVTPVSRNLIFSGNTFGGDGSSEDYGVAIDLGDGNNAVASLSGSGDTFYALFDANPDCGSNLWIAQGIVSSSNQPTCMH
jgi:hypothetical protein